MLALQLFVMAFLMSGCPETKLPPKKEKKKDQVSLDAEHQYCHFT